MKFTQGRKTAGRMALARWLTVGVTASLLAACGGGGDNTGNSGQEEMFLSIATAGTGGGYYPYGGALAPIWEREIDYVTGVSAEATSGSTENVRLLSGGEVEVAMIAADVLDQAKSGTGYFDEEMPV